MIVIFLLRVVKNDIDILKSETITSGSLNIYTVQFNFSPEWDGLHKIAVFRSKNRTISVPLTDGNDCTIPWECVDVDAIRHPLFVGVYGSCNGTIVRPTVWCNLGIVACGVRLGTEGATPTPNLYDHILEELRRKGDGLDIDKQNLYLTSNGERISEVHLADVSDVNIAAPEEVKEMLDEVFPSSQ